MADKKRILIVTQEIKPYTDVSEISKIAYSYSQYLQKNGMEVRVLTPRFGTIHERRHRLHEVSRLSGLNIAVNDEDYPLVIKVASPPGVRTHVYFLDNEEFFKRQTVFKNEDGELYDDNLERSIFFCKGVVEIVKKFGWSPHVVHCHGWMTSLLPAYLKTRCLQEPVFQRALVVYSAYECDEIDKAFENDFVAQAEYNLLEESVLNKYASNGLSLNKGAAAYADGVILNQNVQLELNKTPKMTHEDNNMEAYLDFLEELLKNV